MTERKKFLLRLDPAIHDAVARWAGDELRSANAHIEFLLRRALKEAGRLPADAGETVRRGRPRRGPGPAGERPGGNVDGENMDGGHVDRGNADGRNADGGNVDGGGNADGAPAAMGDTDPPS